VIALPPRTLGSFPELMRRDALVAQMAEQTARVDEAGPPPRRSSGLSFTSSTRLKVGSSSQTMILACFGLKCRCRSPPPSSSSS
jgi:hypothetical protein